MSVPNVGRCNRKCTVAGGNYVGRTIRTSVEEERTGIDGKERQRNDEQKQVDNEELCREGSGRQSRQFELYSLSRSKPAT